MAKKRSRFADYLTYLVARMLICVVQAMSWAWCLNLARMLAWIAYHADRRHRLVAIDNVRQSFPHLDEKKVDRLVRASYVHFATVVIELMRIPRLLHAHNVEDYMGRQAQELKDMYACGDAASTIILVGHFGNWELVGFIAGLVGVCAGMVARRQDNPYLHRYADRFRRKTGLITLDKDKAFPGVMRVLKGGRVMGIAGDQDAGPRGLFVNFFGRPASTFKSIAFLCRQLRVPIVVMAAVRTGAPMQYRLCVEERILPEEYDNRPDAILAITQRFTAALERLIRRYPEQYFWQHRRWKHQPKEVARAA